MSLSGRTPSAPLAARRCAIGAELCGKDTVSFRVWAPARSRVRVVFEAGGAPGELELAPEGNGYFSATAGGARAGTLYRLRLDDDEPLHPDPASRFQPRGHDGPSEVIDPDAYAWRDQRWGGLQRTGRVLYEMHVGTFTREGTWTAAAAALPWLADLGITVIELMPVGEFPGRFGWGYDVVHFFAPTRLYGTPDEMRAFVDQAHVLGMGVILDVVYNHCGTVGCFLPAFSADYFSRKWRSDWGHAMNFDDANAAAVREYFVENAAYWVREFHLDGYRLDATQTIFDSSERHILADIAAAARRAATSRGILLIGENEPQQVRLLAPADQGGADVDALWNDDFHHSAIVALTGRREAYYTDYRGSAQELVSAAKHGFLYQGQYYAWQKQHRGTPTRGLEPARFIHFLQNHDQVANSTRGLRLDRLTSAGRYRAMTALWLLMPQTPMLFQGQEFAASAPFLYFADTGSSNAARVRDGRAEFLSQFPSIAAGGHAWLHEPSDPQVFEQCKLDLAERERHAHAVNLHRDLIALRRRDPVFAAQRADALDGAVLADDAFVLRFYGEAGDDRLLLVNLGRQRAFEPSPEPLLAPPAGAAWKLVWSSEDVAYGGDGTPPVQPAHGCLLPAHAALVFAAVCADVTAPALPGQDETG